MQLGMIGKSKRREPGRRRSLALKPDHSARQKSNNPRLFQRRGSLRTPYRALRRRKPLDQGDFLKTTAKN